MLNMGDSGAVTFSGAGVESSSGLELEQRPCWSLLQLTPDGTWTVAEWRLTPRVRRALAEVEAPDMPLLRRVHVFNRHMDALLRQGGFHEELRGGLQPLHLSIASFFQKAVEDFARPLRHCADEADSTFEQDPLGSVLPPLLWWPRKSGGLGAKHVVLALHGDDNRNMPLLRADIASGQPLELHLPNLLHPPQPRKDCYESHLHAVCGPQIQDLFGTSTIMDSQFTALLV
jgi:hypothetical protein